MTILPRRLRYEAVASAPATSDRPGDDGAGQQEGSGWQFQSSNWPIVSLACALVLVTGVAAVKVKSRSMPVKARSMPSPNRWPMNESCIERLHDNWRDSHAIKEEITDAEVDEYVDYLLGWAVDHGARLEDQWLRQVQGVRINDPILYHVGIPEKSITPGLLNFLAYEPYLAQSARLCGIETGTTLVVLYGDEMTRINGTLCKSRKIGHATMILPTFNLCRHMGKVWFGQGQETPWVRKNGTLVWRGSGKTGKGSRLKWLRARCRLCDLKEVAPVNDPHALSPEQLTQYKYLLSLEGNDVSSGLKWMLASSSVVVMPRPKYEGIGMEGKLVAGVHYVEIKSPDQIDETVQWMHDNDAEVRKIVENANGHMRKVTTMLQHVDKIICPVLRQNAAFYESERERLQNSSATGTNANPISP